MSWENSKIKESINKHNEETEKFESEHPRETKIYIIYGVAGADGDTRWDAAKEIDIEEAKDILRNRTICSMGIYKHSVEYMDIDFDEYDCMYIPMYLIRKGSFFW